MAEDTPKEAGTPLNTALPPEALRKAQAAAMPLRLGTSAQPERETDDKTSWRVSAYSSLNAKHLGGHSTASDAGSYQLSVSGIQLDAHGRPLVVTREITSENGKFNTPLNEHNPGAEINVMRSFAKTTNGEFEAGVSLGQYKNSFYRNSTYLAGNIAYRLPQAFTSPLGNVSAAIGLQAGRVTGYDNHKFGGLIYGELSQDISKHVSLSLKLGIMPTRYTKAHPEENIGKMLKITYANDGAHYEPMPPTRISSTTGVVGIGQIGITGRF